MDAATNDSKYAIPISKDIMALDFDKGSNNYTNAGALH